MGTRRIRAIKEVKQPLPLLFTHANAVVVAADGEKIPLVGKRHRDVRSFPTAVLPAVFPQIFEHAGKCTAVNADIRLPPAFRHRQLNAPLANVLRMRINECCEPRPRLNDLPCKRHLTCLRA